MGGFVAKLNLMLGLAKTGGWMWALVIVIGMNSVISLYYYLRVIVVMYMREPAGGVDAPLPAVPNGIGVAMICTAAITIFLGVWPQGVIAYVNQSARDLLQ